MSVEGVDVSDAGKEISGTAFYGVNVYELHVFLSRIVYISIGIGVIMPMFI